MTKRILLVDDEPAELKNTRGELTLIDSNYEIEVASSGQEALTKVETNQFDIVLCDMIMPGMDGAMLLEEMKKRCPRTARFIYSAPSELNTALKTVDVAHQYFIKPCNSKRLAKAIQNISNSEDLLQKRQLREIILRIDTIPSIPSLYVEISQKLEDPLTSTEDIAKLIERDPAMTAKILKLVNSAFFGAAKQQITSVQEAVAFLGLELVKTLVLSMKVFAQFKGNHAKGFNVDGLWEYSFEAAQMSRMIAQMEKGDKKLYDEAFAGALLQDIGQLVMACNFKKDYERVLYLEEHEDMDLLEVEYSVIGANHADLGAFLMELWGLPESIVRCIKYHHHPLAARENEFTALTAVHVASMILGKKRPVANLSDIEGLDIKYLELLEIQERLPEWMEVMV
ncbi:MAG: response regulator [Verrucomicrobiota bacterium]